ncbi:cytochrome oxidase assembly protein SHY1 [Kluyveromyces marxianus DMKU3-1042]|uniref:SURF1-like protein n=1 Tax=Kluyveromyces marxianus (strain DMKU3-1042 / BCC 29191 / NBRC 104275) TaxID=1003335 RepID=W0TFJ7_KLUMD|nr:cytochrome oxidase assembly protein SHY1 [Kluyveromyces marxianus DMKU3-1042]BAO42155.1 cytochrome oxidase assembly protein SHY1 [Kluyveromyces marxianus DMKU3-1042]
MFRLITPKPSTFLRVRPVKRLYSTVKTSTVDWKPIKTKKTPYEGYQKKESTFTRNIFLGLMIAMPVISFYLGTWQLRRLKWKTNLIASCEDKLTYDPIPLPKHFTPDMCEDWEYRKCTVTGRFLHDEEIFVGPRVRKGTKGYILYTPFIRKDTGERILIERGWIAEEKLVPSSRTLRHLSLPEGDNVTVTVLVRAAKDLTSLQWEKEDRDTRLWQVLDIKDMTAATNTAPIHFQALYDLKDHHWEEEDNTAESTTADDNHSSWKFWSKKKNNSDSKTEKLETKQTTEHKLDDDSIEFDEFQFAKAGVPIGKIPKIDLKNNHLQYLVTWYGLSLLSSIFLVIALRRGRGSAMSQEQIKRHKLKHAKRFM